MKKRLLVLVALTIITLSGCSKGIPQEDYDKVVSERDYLKEENSKLEKTVSEYKTEEAASLLDGFPLECAKAWAETVFSGTSAYAVHDNSLFVSVMTEYSISEESVKLMWDELISGIRILSTMKKTAPETFPFDYVSVMFFDADMNGIYQIAIDTKTGVATEPVLNAMHIEEIGNILK